MTRVARDDLVAPGTAAAVAALEVASAYQSPACLGQVKQPGIAFG